MRLYTTATPPSKVNVDWIYWSKSKFKRIEPDSNHIAALLFITRKKEIEILYRPTPVIDDVGNLEGIIGDMLDEESTPGIIKVGGKDIVSCSTIQIFADIPEIFFPEIPLQADSVKDTKWEEANKKIALIVIPTVAPLPFSMDIKTTVLDDDFIEVMQKISAKHRFWAKMMANVHEQYASDFDNSSVVKNLFNASASFARHDPCRAATKGFRAATHATSGPIVDTSHPGKKHKHEQNIVREFFY